MQSDPPAKAPSLAEQKQALVRETTFTHASALFLEQGYHATTIDDIAKAAGIGRRTFFRYFKTKDDVVLWKFDEFARAVVERLRERPTSEPPLTMLLQALGKASEFYAREPARTVALLKLTLENPALYAQQLLQEERWKLWFAEALRSRMRGAKSSLKPELVASVGLSVFALAVRRWVEDPSADLDTHVARAFAGLRGLLPDAAREPISAARR
jgi:AcrR family transcriptional regulator